MNVETNVNAQADFFEQNDEKVCKKLTKVLRYMTLVFPVLFLATAAGIFQIKYDDLAVLSVLGCICTLGPGVLQKIGTPIRIMKYVSVISVALVVMLLGGNSAVGIYMTYGLAMLLSCMFFDTKFTKQVSVISYFCLIASLFLRSQNVQQIEYPTNMEWFLTRSAGFTIEQILMSVVFVNIAGASRKLLENLHSTEQVAEVVSKCEDVSTKLVAMMDNLAENVQESKLTNETIVVSAQETSADCMKSLSHVSSMNDSVSEMVRASGSIDESTKNVLEISDEICQHMESYVAIMDHAVEDMKVIGQTANVTEEAIHNLEASIMEISGFTDEISEITGQTNLLALNASIEASRAGEQGKGFAVVADEVRSLAERSKQSNSAITSMVSKIFAMLKDVKISNEQNLSSVDAGIAQISNARQEAVNLGQLQADSRTRIEQIARDCDQTKQCSHDVREMSEQMEELVNNSQIRANSIVEKADNQSRITGMTEETFSQVALISKELLGLSKIER